MTRLPPTPDWAPLNSRDVAAMLRAIRCRALRAPGSPVDAIACPTPERDTPPRATAPGGLLQRPVPPPDPAELSADLDAEGAP